jgi:hypothetical protein
MDPDIRANLDAVLSDDVAAQNEAYTFLMDATASPVDWAYDAWDAVVEMLRHRSNRVCAIASQVLCRLGASDPDARIVGDLELIDTEADPKYRKKYAGVWKGVAATA